MYTKIIKRSGRKATFNKDKISQAILKAGKATGELEKIKTAEDLAQKAIERLQKQGVEENILTVETVQDAVEDTLLSSRYKKTAKAYILYRDQHEKIRRLTSSSHIDLVDAYIGDLDWRVKENSNMGYSLQGLNNFIASEVSKNYWLDKIYPKEIGKAHRSGDMHVHDLNQISVYCVGGST